MAEEKHKENLPKAVERVLKDYDLKSSDKRLKAIAVTIGPGQEKSINVGINLAQVRLEQCLSDLEKLGVDLNVPVIPVNHLEGHILVNISSLQFRLQDFPKLIMPITLFLC